jgi:two-component system, OmpR family, response regulator PrrA
MDLSSSTGPKVLGRPTDTHIVGYNVPVPSLTVEPATATILIVDDDEGVTQTFARMLRLEGFEVCTAVNPEVGLRVAHEAHPNAIILDLRMPLLDGVGFLRRLRAFKEHRDTPVAIVTGDYLLDDAVSNEVRELRAELRYKPLWLEDLVGLARDLLKVTH